MNSTNIKLFIGVMLFFAWIGLVVAQVYIPTIKADMLIGAIQSALVGLGVYHMGDGKPEAPADSPPTVEPQPTAVVIPPNAQSGFARPLLLAIIAAAMLAGCAGLTVQWPASCLNVGPVGVTPCSAIVAAPYVAPVIPSTLSLPGVK